MILSYVRIISYVSCASIEVDKEVVSFKFCNWLFHFFTFLGVIELVTKAEEMTEAVKTSTRIMAQNLMVKPSKRRKAMMVKSKAVFGSERFIFNGFDGLLFHPLGIISRSTHSDTAGAVSLKTPPPLRTLKVLADAFVCPALNDEFAEVPCHLKHLFNFGIIPIVHGFDDRANGLQKRLM